MNSNSLISILSQTPIISKQNLALVIGRDGEALNYWVKKLVSDGLLEVAKKGTYLSVYYRNLLFQDTATRELYWMYVANKLCEPSYVSLEYAMAYYGLIPESPFEVTSVTQKSTRKFLSKVMRFSYSNIKLDKYTDYKFINLGNTGFEVKIATPYKAISDYLYLKKNKSSDFFARLNLDVLTKSEKTRIERQYA